MNLTKALLVAPRNRDRRDFQYKALVSAAQEIRAAGQVTLCNLTKIENGAPDDSSISFVLDPQTLQTPALGKVYRNIVLAKISLEATEDVHDLPKDPNQNDLGPTHGKRHIDVAIDVGIDEASYDNDQAPKKARCHARVTTTLTQGMWSHITFKNYDTVIAGSKADLSNAAALLQLNPENQEPPSPDSSQEN